jgi:hypothetical protein
LGFRKILNAPQRMSGRGTFAEPGKASEQREALSGRSFLRGDRERRHVHN